MSGRRGGGVGVSIVLLLDGLFTTVSQRQQPSHVWKALVPCQDHVASQSRPIFRDTCSKSHWAHLYQSTCPLALNLTESTESKSALLSVCREDFLDECAANRILTSYHHSSWSSLCCCVAWHWSLFLRWPGGSQPGQQGAYTPLGKNLLYA